MIFSLSKKKKQKEKEELAFIDYLAICQTMS